jgi:hypothetical protein
MAALAGMIALALSATTMLLLPGGLWQTESRMDQAGASPPPIVLRICRPPTELAEDEPPPMLRGCSVTGVERRPDGLRRQYQCSGRHGTATASVRYAGSPVNEWQLEQAIRPSRGGPVTLTMRARLLGPCPAGMAPGTMQLPNGRVVPLPPESPSP